MPTRLRMASRHILFLDGVYITGRDARCFRRVQPPTAAELNGLIGHIDARVGQYLKRRLGHLKLGQNSALNHLYVLIMAFFQIKTTLIYLIVSDGIVSNFPRRNSI